MAPHNQVRPLHHPDRLRSRAVVGGVGLPGHRVHARPVVVPPGARRRRQFHRVTAAPRSGKPGNGDRLQRRVRRRDGRVRRLVVPQRRRRSGSFAIVPNRRRQGELSSSDRADVAHSWRRHHQVRMAFRLRRSLRYRHLHRCRAVVRGVRFIPHRVHARTVIVRPRARRRCQLLRLAAALRCGKLRHRVHAHLGVRRRDRRVRRPVVPQGRRRSISLTFVPNRRRQRERRPSRGAAIAHRWRRHHQVRMAFRLQLSLRLSLRLRYRHLHRCRAVVRRIRLIPHRVHARTVIVRPGARRRCQLLRLAAAPRCGKLRHRVHGHLGVRRRDRRVRRPVVPQGRRRSISLTFVPNRRRQRERRPSRGAAIAHRWRRHHQVRMAFRLQFSLRLSLRLRYRHLHRCRAVVRRIRLIPHRVHARTVIVRPRARRRCQFHRLAAALRCGKLRHRGHAHLGVRARDGRVGRPVVAQRRRRRLSLALVAHRHRQRERRPSRRCSSAYRRRRHHQIRHLPHAIR